MSEKESRDGSAPDMQKALSQLIPGVYLIGSLVLIFYCLFFWRTGISGNPSDWGTLGDYFGGLMNPVISFATLIVAYAVWKQQREELRHTKVALEDQARTAELHRQEQRFFDLFNVYNRTLDSYTALGFRDRELIGKEAVASAIKALPPYLKYTLRHGFGQTVGEEHLTHEYIAAKWMQRRDLHSFATYLRVVFRLLSEAEPLLGDQHQRYITLFQSQLSEEELRLIGLLSWLDPRWKEEQKLLQKYCLLRHFPEGPLRRDLSQLMPPGIFDGKVSPC